MSESRTPVLYGIANCDTVRKARKWLAQHGVVYTFQDFKKGGLSRPVLDRWLDRVAWETLLNRKSTVWRDLSQANRERITDAGQAIDLMLAVPSVVKRPVLQHDGKVLVGFAAPLYQALLQPRTAAAPRSNE